MRIESKWIWGAFTTLVLLSFIGFITWLILEVQMGAGNSYYISGKGYQLTPIGVLSLLAAFPLVGIVVWYLLYRERSEERDFLKKYERGRRSAESKDT